MTACGGRGVHVWSMARCMNLGRKWGDRTRSRRRPPKAPAAKAALPTNSMALPWTRRPPHLDGTLAGDAGFDPLPLADTSDKLAFMADAEVKHARLAMLCAAGWPLSERDAERLQRGHGVPEVERERLRRELAELEHGGLGVVAPLRVPERLRRVDEKVFGRRRAHALPAEVERQAAELPVPDGQLRVERDARGRRLRGGRVVLGRRAG